MRLGRMSVAVAAAGLALGLAACSSGKPSAKSSTTTAPSVAVATSAPRTTSNDPFCRSLAAYNDKFGHINPGAVTDPQQLRTLMQDAVGAIQQAATTAPVSIKADVNTVSQGMQGLLTAFQQANFDVTKLPVSAFTALQAPDFLAAGQRLNAYTNQNC